MIRLQEPIKEKFYELIYKGASNFPYSNDLMHTGIIGTIPFLAGKYGSELLGKKFEHFKRNSTKYGFLASGLTELLWQTILEPGSNYDHPEDKISDYKGIGETLIGSFLGYLTSKSIEKRKEKKIIKSKFKEFDNKIQEWFGK